MLLIATLTMLTSIFTVNNASCRDEPTPPNLSNIPTPSTPEWFSVTFIDRSYDVPTTTSYTTDYYTGKVTSQINPGYHVENRTIEIVIKNPNLQQYPTTIDGNKSILRYAVQSKGAYSPKNFSAGGGTQYNAQTDSEYTTISLSTDGMTPGGTVNIRIATAFGYQYMGADGLLPRLMYATKLSDWTEAKSITIPEESSTQQIPTSIQELANAASSIYTNYIVPAAIITAVVVLGLGLVYNFRRGKQKAT